MTLSYAIISGWLLLQHDQKLTDRTARILLATAITILVVLLHVMAIRTGLVIFYISLLTLSIIYLRGRVYRKVGAILFIFSVVLPVFASMLVPTMKQKIGYMIFDWHKYQEDGGSMYSDSERILSFKAGYHLFRQSPLVGVGYGDVRQEVSMYYEDVADRPELDKLPHNQFLTYLSGTGIIGAFFWMVGFYAPGYFFLRRKSVDRLPLYLLGFLYLNYTLSFLVENSLDRSMSVAFFLLLVLPILGQRHHHDPSPSSM